MENKTISIEDHGEFVNLIAELLEAYTRGDETERWGLRVRLESQMRDIRKHKYPRAKRPKLSSVIAA